MPKVEVTANAEVEVEIEVDVDRHYVMALLGQEDTTA
jgi:hypothetical protein